jgi:hypothetical protein
MSRAGLGLCLSLLAASPAGAVEHGCPPAGTEVRWSITTAR